MRAAASFATALSVTLVAAGTLMFASQPNAARATSPIDPVVQCNVTRPNTAITPTLLKSGLPCQAIIDTPSSPHPTESIQHDFDYYSWLTFLALNSPANGGVIGTGKGPGGDATTIWENFQSLENLIPANGGTPPPWGHREPPPAACVAAGAKAGDQVMQMIAKLPDLSATNQPFADGPLIDQSGRYTRYQIYVNEPMYRYIVENKLYNKPGQAAFKETIDFPSGQVFKNRTDGTVGAIMIKSAWKILDGKDSPAKFHTMLAFVYTPANEKEHVRETCLRQRVALVGLHVVHKTISDPQWVWSTFEHVANDPEVSAIKAGHISGTFNYYGTKCSQQKCPLNAKPPQPWNPSVQPFPNGFRSQIALVIGLTPEVRSMNASFQRILGNTVWRNYKLISTQWPTDPKNPADPSGSPAPTFLSNTTMETYVQGRVSQVSSCIMCHNNALDTESKPADFTFVLSRAKAVKQ